MMTTLLTLDGMRGAVAIVVVLHHMGLGWAPSGYLAVDFFFLLSGLVIGGAYRTRLRAGLAFRDFVIIRAIRLYPLYAVGGLLGIVAQLSNTAKDAIPTADLLAALPFNLLMFPSLTAPLYAFPLNPPAWSLFFEMAINIVFAAALIRSSRRILLIVITLSGIILAVASFAGHFNEGAFINYFFVVGGVRTTFSFVFGMVMADYRTERLGSEPSLSRGPSIVSVLLIALLIVLMFVTLWGRKRVAYDVLFVMVAAPALVWAGALIEPPAVLRRACKALGDLSYPLYAVHFPAMWIFGAVARHAGASDVMWKALFCITVVPIAWSLGRFAEEPLRRVLNAALLPTRSGSTFFAKISRDGSLDDDQPSSRGEGTVL